ncbi:MAG: dipeptide ABC transporter ATP-binding protein [bacterium]|nr:dipeptide ABC transporter ATP-binding protein [bacterium]
MEKRQSIKNKPLLSINQLKKYFPVRAGLLSKTKGFVHAVDDVNLTIRQGETLGLFGESGCGKSTLARVVLMLIQPTSGKVLFEGQNIFTMLSKQRQQIRRQIQIIFQDPYSSLNPRLTVETIVGEALSVHKIGNKQERRDRILYLLERVGLRPDQMKRYPHEFSGGQRQRIGIARALALNPRLIIGDEPVSALDVSIQAQVLNLLMELQREFSLSFLIISHDLRIVEHVSDNVAVMYLGKFVEYATAALLYSNPLHPYTIALLSAIPHPEPGRKKTRTLLLGETPSAMNPPPGCRFHTRCRFRFDPCDKIEPELSRISSGQWVACHLRNSSMSKKDQTEN